ncbi:hypothetical protein BGZ63DRAFT_391420 [Mariannaea sp. PMI_226]|nr:hypothetical protein BGZ63DRAFT_391420 [Mariannaea sp. PMI_226]
MLPTSVVVYSKGLVMITFCCFVHTHRAGEYLGPQRGVVIFLWDIRDEILANRSTWAEQPPISADLIKSMGQGRDPGHIGSVRSQFLVQLTVQRMPLTNKKTGDDLDADSRVVGWGLYVIWGDISSGVSFFCVIAKHGVKFSCTTRRKMIEDIRE